VDHLVAGGVPLHVDLTIDESECERALPEPQVLEGDIGQPVG
jgi:hypothetical protein